MKHDAKDMQELYEKLEKKIKSIKKFRKEYKEILEDMETIADYYYAEWSDDREDKKLNKTLSILGEDIIFNLLDDFETEKIKLLKTIVKAM